MTEHARNDQQHAWEPLGTHTVCFVPPDVVIFRANGVVDVEDVHAMMRKLNNWPRPDTGLFYISNLTHLTHQSQAVLKEMKNLPQNIFRMMAVVGAEFRHKVALDIILRASKFLGVRLPSEMPRVFDTEAAALAWFDEIRKENK